MTGKKERQMFGTDGVRDVANTGMMTPEIALGLGMAFANFLRARGGGNPQVAVGRDTRQSGRMIEAALSAGVTSAGGDVTIIGEIPTPGVSHAVVAGSFDGGVVISASHNQAEYNGIKFMDGEGYKLSDSEELLIEELFYRGNGANRPTHGAIGSIRKAEELKDEYLGFLKNLMDELKNDDFSLVIDAANGAASGLVAPLFEEWKGKVSIFANEPDGMNINSGVGVTNIDFLRKNTMDLGFDLGIAYDGDTDRVLMCDRKGRVLDGDIMLWVIGRWLAARDELGPGVVATVMSNMVLEDLLKEEGLKLYRSAVGDRYVLDAMKKEGCRLGGEQSGHIIALDYANTGDGLCSTILFLKAAHELREDISTLVDRFDRYPQILKNIRIENKEAILNSPKLKMAEEQALSELEGRGRMLIRPSGTEPLIRIFVESRDRPLMDRTAKMLENTIMEISEQ